MNSEELVRAANEARPDLMVKTAIALAAIEKLDPAYLQEVIGEFNSITGSTVEKVASMGGMAPIVRAVGTAGAVALAGSLATDLYDAAKRKLTQGTSLKRILESNPELSTYKKEDVRKAFDTMHRYAPEFTADPNLGGQVIHRMVELPHENANLIMQLLAARKNIRDTKKNQFSLGNVNTKDEVGDKKIMATYEAALKAKADAAMLNAAGDIEKRLTNLRVSAFK